MTNAMSTLKLYSTSEMLATHNWVKNVSFVDKSAMNIKKLVTNNDNVSLALTVNIEKEIVPLFAPKFANKEFDDGPETSLLSISWVMDLMKFLPKTYSRPLQVSAIIS